MNILKLHFLFIKKRTNPFLCKFHSRFNFLSVERPLKWKIGENIENQKKYIYIYILLVKLVLHA